MTESILFGCFLTTVVVQLYYYLFYFLHLAKYKESIPSKVEQPGVSVIIAAKNEARNIETCLRSIESQHYSCFEIIVINNHSSDETLSILEGFPSDRLKYFDFKEREGKKAALLYGIQQAQYDYLVFTDADCIPASNDWLKGIVYQLVEGKEIVLGYGQFVKGRGLLNALIRFEGLLNAVQYFSYALKGVAYMGVGRNLAYQKGIVRGSSVFDRFGDIKSGDDDLLVNEMATADNVGIVISEKTHTISRGEDTWKSYFSQKRRQLEAGSRYKSMDRLRLAVFGSTSFLYYVLLVVLTLLKQELLVIIAVCMLKQTIECLIFSKISKKLGEKISIIGISILEPIYMLVISAVGVSTWIWRIDKWK